jgi:hypothetical protein
MTEHSENVHMGEITEDTVLQLNQGVIASLGESVEYLLESPCGDLTHLPPLSNIAVSYLKRFTKPTAVKQVSPSCSTETITVLTEAVATGLLVQPCATTSDGLVDSDHWAAFRLINHGTMLSAEANELIHRRVIQIGSSQVFVMDGLFSEEATASIYWWIIQLGYKRHDIDSLDTAKYKHWISRFDVQEDVIRTVPFVDALLKIAELAFPHLNTRLCRAHAYCVPYGDVQNAHVDFDHGSGLTVLYFANPTWPQHWQSEMLFYGTWDEPEYAVSVRPGRIIVFPGDIRHRAGVPSFLCTSSRYVVVLRLLTE